MKLLTKSMALLLAVSMIFLSGCQSPEKQETTPTTHSQSDADQQTEPAYPKEFSMTVGIDEGNGWLSAMLKKFEAAHPEYTITWNVVEEIGIEEVQQGAEGIPDVYMYAASEIYTLAGAGITAPVDETYAAQIQKDNFPSVADCVLYSDGKLYGFPMSGTTDVLYYDTAAFTVEDVKSLDRMLEKGMIDFPLEDPLGCANFFLANGGQIFGEHGNDVSAGVTFGGEAGRAAAKKMVWLRFHEKFNPSEVHLYPGRTLLTEGKIGAYIEWGYDYKQVREMMGDRLGIAPLPMAEIGGKDVPLISLVLTDCLVVNPNAPNPQAAMELAQFLSGAESQLLRYELAGVIPCAKALQTNEKIQGDPMASVQLQMIAAQSSPMPCIEKKIDFIMVMYDFQMALSNRKILDHLAGVWADKIQSAF